VGRDKDNSLGQHSVLRRGGVEIKQTSLRRKIGPAVRLNKTGDGGGVIGTHYVKKQKVVFYNTKKTKKNNRHIKGQARYCNHKRLNNAFMMHAATSPR
ncbi:hypothetical protein, partial [Vibrio parahaemolyticus]|uniref:hypothetical protein n=1 Tax=Vibrio parahaemolyticus TaxID=670 RepID=UPI001F51E496